MKNDIYKTVQTLEKNRETSLLINVMDTRKEVEKLNDSLLSIDNILKAPTCNKVQLGGLFYQNSNDYKSLITQFSKQVESEHSTHNIELQRQEFHLNRQASRTKLIETLIEKRDRKKAKIKLEREQSRLSDMLSVTRQHSIFK